MKKGYILLASLGCIILVLSLVQISVSNMLSTGGIELAQIQTGIQEYQKENAILKEQIYSVASITHIADEAQKLGYVPGLSKSTLVITNPQPFALKP
jgi:cell division protein FtsL